MANILDYIKWRGDIDFAKSPFNIIDNVIFSQIVYLDFLHIADNDRIVSLKEAGKQYFLEKREQRKNTGDVIRDGYFELLRLCMNSERFKDIKIFDYVNKIDIEKEMQFSALTIEVNDFLYVSFCGTDDTLIGWKEDFNMTILDAVPSQKEALIYLANICEKYADKKIIVGGHSKGGNLAVYAGVFSNKLVQDRIVNIYNNDGPGYKESLENNQNYMVIKDKIINIAPEYSFVSIMYEHLSGHLVVKSDEKGLMQHNAFSWQVEGIDFVYAEDLAKQTYAADKTLKRCLNELNDKQREEFVNAMFDILSTNEKKTLSDIKEDGIKALLPMLKTYDSLNDEAKKLVNNTFYLIFSESIKSIKEENGENVFERFKHKFLKGKK